MVQRHAAHRLAVARLMFQVYGPENGARRALSADATVYHGPGPTDPPAEEIPDLIYDDSAAR